MIKREIILFKRPGPRNTEATLEAVSERASEVVGN